MYERIIEPFIQKVGAEYPVVTVIGPRQSGKSTLTKKLFGNYDYVNLEDPDTRTWAETDARGFFQRYKKSLIIDEVQRVPELLSYIQTIVDDPKNDRRFVLTGSAQLLLMEKVSQSLAGRTFIAKLLPLSREEIDQGPGERDHLDAYLLTGGYPRIYDQNLEANGWLGQYYQTYVEKDVRSIANIGKHDLFERFIHLCAGRVGQLLNLSSLASDVGISVTTAQSWLSVLKTSFVCWTLKPHFQNFNKRVIKSPKLYFYDTGLLLYLLQIKNAETLAQHPLRGAIFENFVVLEMLKKYYNQGQEPPLYFWRDAKGHEVDVVIDRGLDLYPIEIKSSYTFHPDFLKTPQYFQKLQRTQTTAEPKTPFGSCIYAGDESFDFKDYKVQSWRQM